MPRRWRTVIAAAVTCAVAAVAAWFWERGGTEGINSFAGSAASVISLLGGGGLVPLWKWARRTHDPAGAPENARTRAERRRRLAGNIERQLIFSYGQGEWSDEQYAELKAEFYVDAILPDDIPWWQAILGRDTLLRRERSLTRALLRMRPRIVILEGEPGSGKSVALRHLALKLARRAERRRWDGSLLPVYVNLKDFRPAAGQVDSESVRAFVYETLVSRDSGIGGFLDAEFGDTLTAGSWLLLFDSFDEIPAVLGATEADEAVREYAKAIIDFAANRGFRAVIASREFRGPRGFPLPRLRIVRLTDRQQRVLIRRSGLPRDMAGTAATEITRAGPDLRQLTDNPLFLWLVCQYLRDNNGVFPESAYGVFDSYVRHRLTADEGRLREKFGVEAGAVRSYAEQFAFFMASSPDLGLTPATGQLTRSISALPTTSSLLAGRVPAVLDALVYLRLGRYETSPSEPGVTRFTFTHRRLQEYFATCAVFSRPGDVPPRTLLTQGQWRETAVATFQTRPADAADRLLAVLREMLTGLADQALQPAGQFAWPPGLLHLLDVLAAGLGRTPERIPDDIRGLAGQVLTRAWDAGSRYDQLWATDVVRVAPGQVTDDLLTRAFNSRSRLLQEAALQQAAWLNQISMAAEAGLRRLLVALWASGDLAERSGVIGVQLRRFRNAATLLPAFRLLRWVMAGDLLLLALFAAYVLTVMGHGVLACLLVAALVLVHIGLRLDRPLPEDVQSRPAGVPLREARGRRFRPLGSFMRLIPALVFMQMELDHAVPGPPMSVATEALCWSAIVYQLSWPYAALGHVVAGDSIPLWTWPLLPPHSIARTAGRVFRALAKASPRQLAGLVAVLVFPVAVALFATLFGPSLQRMIGQSSSGSGVSEGPVIVAIAFVVAMAAASIAQLVAGVRQFAARRRLWKRRRAVLAEARRRTEPYTAVEIAAALGAIRTSSAVRELAETLRLTPALCPAEVIGLFSDLLNAAELTSPRVPAREKRPSALGIRRAALAPRPPVVAIPPVSGSAFTAWATDAPTPLDQLLRALDEETLDEITRLIVTCRKP